MQRCHPWPTQQHLLLITVWAAEKDISINNHPQISGNQVACCREYVFCHLTITRCTYNLQSCDNKAEEAVLRWRRAGLCLSAGAAAMATTDEMFWVNYKLTVGSLYAFRLGADLLEVLEKKPQSIQWNEMLPCTCSHWLPAPSVTPISSGLLLKIRGQLSLVYLILRQSPRIPRTKLSWGGCREEEWSHEPFGGAGSGVHKCLFWTVSVSWQWPGRHDCLLVCVSVGNSTQKSVILKGKVRTGVLFKSRIR